MAKKEIAGYVCDGVAWVMLAIQTNELLGYIQLGLAILSTTVSLCYTIYKWYQRSRKDGKITKDEVKQLFNEGADILFHANQINAKLDQKPKTHGENKEVKSKWNQEP